MFRTLITATALVPIFAASFAAHGLAQTCPTPTAFTSGTSVVASADPSFFSITPGPDRWSAVGVRADDGKDWNLMALDVSAPPPGCWHGLLASSAESGIDFAVTDWRIRAPDTDYIRTNTGLGIGTSARVQYEQMFYDIRPDQQYNHLFMGANDVLKLQETELVGGVRYFIEVFPSAGLDSLKFYLFAPAPTSAGWIPRSGRVLEGTLVSGGGNLFEYTPSTTGYYALVVTNEKGLAGDFYIGLKNCPFSSHGLVNKLPYFSILLDEYPNFVPPAPRWNVVGVRGDVTLYGMDIAPDLRDQNGLYGSCTDSVLAEQYSGLGAKVIAGDFRTLPQRFYSAHMSVEGQPFTTPGAYIEWEDGQDSLVVNAPPTVVSPPDHNVIDTWGVSLLGGGTYNFQLTRDPGATAAYKMMIFWNSLAPGTPYWAARPDAIAEDPAYISVGTPVTDQFCVVVVNDNGGTGGYSIQVTSDLVGASPGPSIPRVSRIRSMSPNPSPGATRIDYDLARSGRAALRVTDVAGRVVANLSPTGVAGAGSLTWNGRADDGTRPAAGVYFVTLSIDGVTHDHAKMIMLR
jgi:hypothetical protein